MSKKYGPSKGSKSPNMNRAKPAKAQTVHRPGLAVGGKGSAKQGKGRGKSR